MLFEAGSLKRESSGNGALNNCDNLRKRSPKSTGKEQGDGASIQQARDSTSSEVEGKGVPTTVALTSAGNSQGSLKRNRTARKDGGAKRWENANSEVLQPANGNCSLSSGSIVWGKRGDGLWWPGEISRPERNTPDKSKSKAGNHTLVKFFGLEEVDGRPLLSYLDVQSVRLYADCKDKFAKQNFLIPEDGNKFDLALVEADKVYASHSKVSLKLLPAEMEGAEFQDTSKKRSRKSSGSGAKSRSKEEATNEEPARDEKSIKSRKRKRQSKDPKDEKCVASEGGSPELLADMHAKVCSKKRKLSAVHSGLNKETAGKQEIHQSGSALRDKTRGDDGYFFECVVCDMGGNLLCCDSCPCTYHLDCLDPPLKRTPAGKWRCPACRENTRGIKAQAHRGSDSRRSRSTKHKEESICAMDGVEEPLNDVAKQTVKGLKSEKKDTSEMAPLLPLKRSKSLKKINQRKSDSGRKVAKKVFIVRPICPHCGTDSADGHLLNGEMVCKQCYQTRSLDTGGCEVKEPEDMVASNKELEVWRKPSTNEGEKKKDDNGQKKAHIMTLEVDRIFGCRSVSKADSFGSVRKQSLQEEDLQLQSRVEIQSECRREASALLGLPPVENGTGHASSSLVSSLQEKPASETPIDEATSSSCLVSGGIGRKEDLLNVDASIRSEGCNILESENEDTPEVEKDLNDKVNNPPCVDEMEFLVKWVGRSHIHDQWVGESELKVLAKRKLDNYKFKYGYTCINLVEEKWCKPQRIIAERKGQCNAAEVLVKWCGLPYDECTWEDIEEPIIQNHPELLESFDYFESAALKIDDGSNKKPCEICTLIEQPEYLKGGSLFPHQMEALNWLRKCWGRKKNVILADEMGLGKTISASAFLCSLYKEFKVSGPCLVLVPLSTMPNWMAEFSVWTPQLNVVEYHGGSKARANIRQFEWHAAGASIHKKDHRPFKFNVLLTTYEMIIADASQLRSVAWEVLIVDEGHRLKNTGSKLVQLLNTFSFSQRVLLTGTPLQNNIGEMHNLLKFLQLDAFPSLTAFQDKFSCLSTAEQVEELKKLVAPHMLRRLKKDAMQNIPPKMERVVPVELTSLQAEYYRALLTRNYQVLRQAGKPNQHQSLVNIVVQLRKVCNHPYLISGTEPETGSVEFLQEMRIKASAKLTLLHAMLKVLREQGHRVLIFSQMTRLLDILEDYLTIEFGSKTFERVDGSISVADRQAAIARFNQDSSRFVFLLSTRACGLGINLATADTVIIYDSDFNPHADIQAMNRAHRIGQSKRLLVYRLVVRASVEERILQLAKKKLMLDHLFANKSGSQKEVEDILRWGTEELFQDGSALDEGPSCEEEATESLNEPDGKQRKRSGGLGDVYEDTCHKSSRPKIFWDDAAVARLLDRSDNGTEAVDAEGESDMLGSLKTWDWNEQDTTEDQEANEVLTKDKDAGSPVDANSGPAGQGTEEESNWDKILRTRWEKLQVEEEGALGRGKRMRKTVSYKEDFNVAVAEVLNESGNEEEEDAEIEYTPAGRALKNKLARLRARQKERIASRNNKELGSNFGMIQSIFSDYNGAITSLPPSTTSMFLPVQLSEQDLQFLYANTGLATSLIAMPTNRGTGKGNLVSAEVETSSRVQPTLSSLQGDSISQKQVDYMLKEMPATSSSEPVSSSLTRPIIGGDESSLNGPSIFGTAIGVQASNSLLDPGSSSVSPPEKNLQPFDGADCYEKPPELALVPIPGLGVGLQVHNQSLAEAPSFGSAVKSTPPKIISDLTMSLGLGSFPEPSLDPLRAWENTQKLMQIQSLGSANISQAMNIVNSPTPLQGCAPKLEADVGCGSSMLGHSIHWSDEKKGKRFPFFSCFGGEGAGPHITGASVMWTDEELDTLWAGVRRHGRGNWVSILQDPKLYFSKLKTAKDLAERWKEEEIKMFGGPFNHLDTPLNNEGSKSSFSPFSAGLPTPSAQGNSFLDSGGPKDFIRELGLQKFDMEGLYHRASKSETGKLLGLPPLGAEVRNRLTPFSTSACEGVVPAREDVPWIDLGQKRDLPTAGLPKVGFSPNKQGADLSRSHRFLSTSRSISHANSLTSPFLITQNPLDLQMTNLLPRGSVGDTEWKFSNLHSRFEKGSASAPIDPLELPKLWGFPDKLQLSLPDLPRFKTNLKPVHSDKLPEIIRGNDLHQKVFGVKGDKEKSKANQNVEGPPSNSTSSSLPHWLREAVKPAPNTPVLPSTIAAVSHAIDMVYRECKPTLPAWVSSGPLPMAPHRKSRRRRKRKKGVGLRCRPMGDAHPGVREHLGNILLPNFNPLGKQNHLSMLSLGNGRLSEGSLAPLDIRQASTFLNAPSLPPFPWTLGQNYDSHGIDNSHLALDLPESFPSLSNLPLPVCTVSENLPVPSPFMSFGQFVTSDLALNSLFPEANKGLKGQDQGMVQQGWPFAGSASMENLPAVPPLNLNLAKAELPTSEMHSGQKPRSSPSAKSEGSSSKTHSDSCIKISAEVKSNHDDDASSEQTVSDSKNHAD